MNVTNEQETLVKLVQMIQDRDDVDIVSAQVPFPDLQMTWGGESLRVELEFKLSSFIDHDHDGMGCDLVICWVDDLGGLPFVPVIALSEGLPESIPVVEDREVLWLRYRVGVLESRVRRMKGVSEPEDVTDWEPDMDQLHDYFEVNRDGDALADRTMAGAVRILFGKVSRGRGWYAQRGAVEEYFREWAEL